MRDSWSFFDKTIKAGNLGSFVRSLTARPDKTYAPAVLQKLKQNSKVEVEDFSGRLGKTLLHKRNSFDWTIVFFEGNESKMTRKHIDGYITFTERSSDGDRHA